MRLLSKFAMGVSPLNSTMAYIWKLLRMYCMRPEVILFAVLCVVFVAYLHVLEIWSQSIVRRVGYHFGGTSMRSASRMATRSAAERNSWDEKYEFGAVYAVQGRRPRMEDRLVIYEHLISNNRIVAI